MNQSNISVVIPFCKTSPLLWEAVDSVLVAARMSPVKEILLVPNAGSDNAALASQVSDRYTEAEVRVVIREIEGIVPVFQNWNECVLMARGEFIHILHDDDLVDEDFYFEANSLVQKFYDASLIYLGSRFFGSINGVAPLPSSPKGVWESASKELATRNYLLCPGVVFRKDRQIGFDSSLKYTADWRAWYDLSCTGNVVVCHKVCSSYRVHQQNTTHQLITSGDNVREALATAKVLSSKYYRSKGEVLDHIPTFAASLGYAESINAAERGDVSTWFLQLRLAVAAQFSLRSFARCLRKSVPHLLRSIYRLK